MNKNPTGEHPDAYFVGYVIFILWAVAFSGLCVAFVRMFAPYACGKFHPKGTFLHQFAKETCSVYLCY